MHFSTRHHQWHQARISQKQNLTCCNTNTKFKTGEKQEKEHKKNRRQIASLKERKCDRDNPTKFTKHSQHVTKTTAST
jgi:hypothetical protein